MSVAEQRLRLVTVPSSTYPRYLLDILEIYLGFFAVVAALAPPNPTLYAIDFYVSLASLVAYAYRVLLSPLPLRYILLTSWELPSMIPLIVAHRYAALADIVVTARLLRIIVIVAYGSDLARLLRGFIRSLALSPIFTLFAMTILMGSLAYYAVENGLSVHSYFDALWFTIVTITTVGYGDIVPVSTAGKALTMVLMLIGIVLWSVTIAVFTTAAARSVGRVIARELERLEQRRYRRLFTMIAEYAGVAGEKEDLVTTCMMAALSLPPDEFEELIEELRRRYQAIHGGG